MDDIRDFIIDERAKFIFSLCKGDGAVISMETCKKIARLWTQSNSFAAILARPYLGEDYEQNHQQ